MDINLICPNTNLPEWKQLVQDKGLDGALRQWITGQSQTKVTNNIEKALQRILPSSIGREAIEKLAGNPDAWGAYRNKIIYLASQATTGTAYHEAFHAVYRLMLTDNQIEEYNSLAYKEILAQAKANGTTVAKMIAEKQKDGHYPGMTAQASLPMFIEEWMADKFQEYMAKPKKNTTWIGQLFSRLRNFIKGINSKKKDISVLFRQIESGKFKSQPFVTNQFSQEDRASEVVYQILSKALREGPDGPMLPKFGADETSQIVRDTASYYFDFKDSELSKRERWTDEAILDKIIDLKKKQYSAYSDPKYLGNNEHDYYYLFSNEDFIEEDGTVILGERTILKQEILKYLKNFKKLESLSKETDEDAVDDVGDKTYLNAEMKNEGGWGTLPVFVREYIAKISYPIDSVILGYRDDITREGIPTKVPVYQKKALNPTKVYNGLLRALANELSEDNMIEKLVSYGQLIEYVDENGNLVKDGGNVDTHYFVQRFLKDTKLDVDKLLNRENLDEKQLAEGFVPKDDLNANLIYQKVLKGFNRWAKDPIFSEYNFTTKEAKVYLANRKNVAQQQFDQWSNNFNNKTKFNKESVTKEFSEMVTLFQESNPYYTDQLAGEDFAESKTREQLLAEDIGKVKKALLSVGIDVSPNYIKYSLLYPKLIKFNTLFEGKEKEFSRDTLTKEEYRFLTSTIVERNQRIKYEDFTELSKTISKDKNPYQKSDTDTSERDDANIGRIQNLAKGNAVFDETVFESSYIAADGTMRYLHQDGTYHLKAVGKLRDPKFIEQLKNSGIRDTNITIGTNPLTGESINIDDIDSEFVTDNFLFSPNSDFLKVVSKLKLQELDGIKMTSDIYDSDGEFIGTSSTDGVHFGDMSDREFSITLLNLYAQTSNYELDENNKKVTVVPQLVSVMETSKSSDIVYLPVVKGLYTDSGVSIKMIDITRNELKKEYNRITKVYSQITNPDGTFKSDDQIQEDLGYLADEYHTGKRRALSITDKLSPLFSPEFIKTLESVAKTKDADLWFNDNQEAINEQIKTGLETLVEDTLNLISNIGIINNGEKGVNNEFLSKQYFKESDQLGFTDNFEHNIGQVTMQQWINTLAFSHLIHGDNALMYKNDGADPYKREKPNNAKIVSFKHNRTIEKLGVTPFNYSRMVIIEEPKDISKLFPKGDKIDQADAQMWGSVQAIRNSLFGLGKLTPDVAKVLDKMERGETLSTSDLFDANGEVINQDRFINSFKFVFKDSKRTVKMSVVALTKELTSDFINGRWIAKPGREELHNMREAMEGKDENGNSDKSKAFDFVGPKSAFKTFRANILKSSNGSYNYNQARPELYDNEYFGLQLENPTNKTKITTPTQLLHAIDNEQDESTMSYIIGNDTPVSISDVRRMYQKALANKSKVMFEGAKAEMYEIPKLSKDLEVLISEGRITPRLARFQQKAIENLKSSGADPQLLEFFEVVDGQPTQNLNNDLVIEKYTQLYLSHFSKGAFSLKNPGHAVALFSNFSMGLVKKVIDIRPDGQIVWEVVRSNSDEYNAVRSTNTQFKNFKWEDRLDESQDIKYIDTTGNLSVGSYFVDKPAHMVPEYKNGIIVGYYSEAILPFQTADQANLVGKGDIPASIAYLFGNRIPLQDKHSMLSMKWVDTMPLQYGSTGVFPSEIVQLSGADFDIDKLYISAFDTYTKDGNFYRYGEKESKEEQFTEYLKWQLKNNKFLKSFITEFKNEDEVYKLLEDQLWSLKNKIKSIKNSKEFKENQFALELVNVLERATGIRYDEDGNIIRTYEYGEPVANASQKQLLNKLNSLTAEIAGFDPTLASLEYYAQLTKDIHDALTQYEYTYLHEAIKKYAPTMPSSVEEFDNLYNTGAANNQILKSFFSLLTNDHVRNGIADQPATQDYIKSGGNRESNDMNPAFIREDGTEVFGSQKRYPIDSLVGHVNVKRKNNIGKDNIGIDVSGNVQNTILKKGQVDVLNKDLHIKIYSEALEANVVFDSFAPTQERDMTTGEYTGKRIMDVISTKISSSTDEAKDGNNAKFNLGSEASKILSVMNGMGVPLEICIAILNQPTFAQGFTKYKKNGIVTEEESKYTDPEKAMEAQLKELQTLIDMETAKAEDQEFIQNQLDKYGSLDHLFTFDNLARFVREGGKHKADSTAEERVTFNTVQAYAFGAYMQANEISNARAKLGNILKLNKGLKDFSVLDKALQSAYELGILDGDIKGKPVFDVRYIFTGNSSYKSPNDYVHDTSVAYLNQVKQLSQLAKLNFVTKTNFVNQTRTRVSQMIRLNKDAPQLEKDMLSFITLSAYKSLSNKANDLTNALLEGTNDNNIIDLYKKIKELAPTNPLVKYIITNKKYLPNGTFNTLEANSFTRLNDIQLGNLINGYIDLYQNTETRSYAQALFDYVIVKDAMQFKNKSITKIFPAELFINISDSTKIVHNLLLATDKAAYLRVATQINLEFPSRMSDGDLEQLNEASEQVVKNTLFDRITGYSEKDLYNRFIDVMYRQPLYSKKARYIRPGNAKGAVKNITNGYEFNVKGDVKANIFALRQSGFDDDIDNGIVYFPKYIRSNSGSYMLTELNDTVNPNGLDLPFTTNQTAIDDPANNTLFKGQRAVYTRIETNKNEQWNQMSDLIDLRLEKSENNVKLVEPVLTEAPIVEVKSDVKIESTDKVIFGHPTIGKSFLKEKGEDKFISLDDDFGDFIKTEVQKIIDKFSYDAKKNHDTILDKYEVQNGGTKPWNDAYNQMMQSVFLKAVDQAKKENKQLFTSNTKLLKNNINLFDKVIDIPTDTFIDRVKTTRPNAKYDIAQWKNEINDVIKQVPKDKVITTTGYLSDLLPKSAPVVEQPVIDPNNIDFAALNAMSEDEQGYDDVEYEYKGSPFKNKNNSEDNSKRCD